MLLRLCPTKCAAANCSERNFVENSGYFRTLEKIDDKLWAVHGKKISDFGDFAEVPFFVFTVEIKEEILLRAKLEGKAKILRTVSFHVDV